MDLFSEIRRKGFVAPCDLCVLPPEEGVSSKTRPVCTILAKRLMLRQAGRRREEGDLPGQLLFSWWSGLYTGAPLGISPTSWRENRAGSVSCLLTSTELWFCLPLTSGKCGFIICGRLSTISCRSFLLSFILKKFLMKNPVFCREHKVVRAPPDIRG